MGKLRGSVAVAAFVALYLVAALFGRAAVIDGQDLSLVWPAAGVAVVWLLSLTRTAPLVSSMVLLVLATVVANVATGTTGKEMAAVSAANLLQIAAVVGLLRQWCPEVGLRGGRPPLESTGSLLRFLLAAALGCLIGVISGVAGLALVGEPLSPYSALTWWGRNTVSVVAVGTTGLLLIHHLTHRGQRPDAASAGRLEAAALLAVTAVIVAGDHASGTPLTLLLPATTVWTGLRFRPLFVSAHAALAGAAVIWLTLHGSGLFPADLPQRTSVLLAQLFVGMTIMLGLLLAASRQEGARLQAQLNERQRELAAFSRRAAHDLQNPLMVVQGWAEILASRVPASTPESEMVHRIQAATERTQRLVAALLDHATARDRPLLAERVDIAVLVREIADTRGISSLVRVSDIDPVHGDETMIRQLLDNLVGNAVKYVAPGKTPDVEVDGATDRDGRVTITVADRGIGIPAESLEAVFTEFTRGHGDEYPGTGLGLSICRRIVERHGGEISARARRAGGTTFEVRLPAWPPRPSLRSPAAPVVAPNIIERQEPWRTMTSSR